MPNSEYLGDLSEIMTASSLWAHALEEFCAVEIPASEGPVAEVGHHIAPSCIMDERLWSSGGSSNPLAQMPFPHFDLNKKDNTCAHHVVPTTVRGWSRTKGRCWTLSGTCLLTCMMDETILVDNEVLKSLDRSETPTLSYLSVVICKLTSGPTEICFICSLAVCVFFFRTHLFVLPHIWSSFFPDGTFLLMFLI